MTDALTRYKNGEDVQIKDLSFPLFIFILQERWKSVALVVLLFLFIFLVGYYVGYNNAVVEMNKFILENYVNVTEQAQWGINWTI